MEFENTFTVEAPADDVYEALLDIERVAPAMPGAQVLEKTSDDSYKVAIKVRLGPVTMTYRGDVTIVERDPVNHSARLDVKAREARGQGTANAKVTMSAEPEGDATRVTMHTTVRLSGKAAAMSRGVIDDVSKRLVGTFAENLEGILAPSSPRPSADDEGLRVAPIAASMAAERVRDPRLLGALIVGALFLVYLIGRRS